MSLLFREGNQSSFQELRTSLEFNESVPPMPTDIKPLFRPRDIVNDVILKIGRSLYFSAESGLALGLGTTASYFTGDINYFILGMFSSPSMIISITHDSIISVRDMIRKEQSSS